MPREESLSERLRVGSSGGDHSIPSSSRALDRTRNSSVSMPVLAALGCADGRGLGSTYEPDSSAASEDSNDMLSSMASTRSHQTKPDCSKPQRNDGPEGTSGQVKPLLVERARHEEAQRSSAPLLFSHRRKKGRGHEGQSRSLKRELSVSKAQ